MSKHPVAGRGFSHYMKMLHLKVVVLCSTILLLWTVAPAEPRVATKLSESVLDGETDQEGDIESEDGVEETVMYESALIDQGLRDVC